MATELKMPALSPTMEEGTLAKWLVKEGDEIAAGDILAEIETDKATMEFEAVDEGTLLKILVEEGTDNVAVGTVIAMVGEEGDELGDVGATDQSQASGAKPAAPEAKEEPKEEKTAPKKEEPEKADKGYGRDDAPKPEAKSVGKEAEGVKAPAAPVKDGERVKASPLARRLAEARGIDLTEISGSGPKGRIVRADIDDVAGTAPKKAEAAAAPAAAPRAEAKEVEPLDIPHEVEKLSNMRKTIARRLTEAKQDIPHIYLTVDCQLDELLKLRSRMNKSLEARGQKLSVNDFLIKALALALIEVPECNVSFAGANLIKYSRADISVAVSIDGGLITPIVADANSKSLSKISDEVKDLAGRAKDGKLAPEEYQGGTASISNMGMFGIKQFDAVINPPQAMILAVGAGEKRPHVIDDRLQVATVMSATGSFDHRAIDGADGAKLMQAFKRLVEDPMGLVA